MQAYLDVPAWKKGVYASLTVILLFGGMEIGLRVAGFSRPTTLEAMAFTFPLDEFNREAPVPFLQRDALLFWRPRPHVLGHNSKGIYGPEFADSRTRDNSGSSPWVIRARTSAPFHIPIACRRFWRRRNPDDSRSSMPE